MNPAGMPGFSFEVTTMLQHPTIVDVCVACQWTPDQFAAGLQRAIDRDTRQFDRDVLMQLAVAQMLQLVTPAGNC